MHVYPLDTLSAKVRNNPDNEFPGHDVGLLTDWRRYTS